MSLPERLRQALRDLPARPGCYIFRDRCGEIIYIGKARSLRKRVRSYFRPSAMARADPKLRGLLHSVQSLETIITRTEAEAILTEDRLIKEFKPRYNVDLRDDKRFLLLRTEPDRPYPRFRLCRIMRRDGALYFGPYASAAAARATLDFVEKTFGLRHCSAAIPDWKTRRHCLDDVIRYCSAPCRGQVTASEYRARFDRACAFLRGERREELGLLRERMKAAAARLDFEQAAALRDTLMLITKAVREKASIAAPPAPDAASLEAALDGIASALGLAKRPRMIECFDVSCIAGALAVGSMVCAIDGMPRRNRYRRFRLRMPAGADDASMIAEIVRRRYRRALEEGGRIPDLVLVDGGAQQVRAARMALDSLGLVSARVAGLAKRFEEVYVENSLEPLRIAADSSALKLLQRMRDEAHRFALSYHLSVRKRRLEESVLDEIPGIGRARRNILLARFGSVRRLAAADESDIAKTPKIGYELARLIKQTLSSEGG